MGSIPSAEVEKLVFLGRPRRRGMLVACPGMPEEVVRVDPVCGADVVTIADVMGIVVLGSVEMAIVGLGGRVVDG